MFKYPRDEYLGYLFMWLIQETLFNEEEQHNSLLKALKDEHVVTIPYTFWEEIIDLKLKNINPEKIIPFGTCSLIYYGLKNKWNVSWDTEYSYSKLRCLGEDFINYDLQLNQLSLLDIPYNGKIYLREDAGFNTFKGRVISCYAWNDVVNGMKRSADNEYRRDHSWHAIEDETLFTVSSVKKILEEYRVFVVNNKIVTSSRYIVNNEFLNTNTDNNPELNIFVQKMLDKLPFKNKTFTIDIFRTEEGRLKVGELNCIHCSGWYNIDLEKLVTALKKNDIITV